MALLAFAFAYFFEMWIKKSKISIQIKSSLL